MPAANENSTQRYKFAPGITAQTFQESCIIAHDEDLVSI